MLEHVEQRSADAQWRSYFRFAADSELDSLEADRAALIPDNGTREAIERWANGHTDRMLARRAFLVLQRLQWVTIESQPIVYRLRKRIDGALSKFRPQFAGRTASRLERRHTLRYNGDRNLRRQAWLALNPLAEHVEPALRELLRERQRLACEQGYAGYVSWANETFGLSQARVEQLFDDITSATDVVYRAWLARTAQELSISGGIRPWDLDYAAESQNGLAEMHLPPDSLYSLVRQVADGMGLREAASGVRVDVAEIPYAALCFAVNPPDDVRILLGKDNGGINSDVLFHEFGHALHWRNLRPVSPVFRWESPAFNEAMACLWERLASEPDVLIAYQNVAPDRAAVYREKWVQRTVFRVRKRIAQADFERRAYQNLQGDLASLHRDVCARYLCVPFDENAGWAASPFWSAHPVYRQHHVIGEVAASQVLNSLKRRFGSPIDQPLAGEWLAEHLYRPGAMIPWDEKLTLATGARLNAVDLATDLRSANA